MNPKEWTHNLHYYQRDETNITSDSKKVTFKGVFFIKLVRIVK